MRISLASYVATAALIAIVAVYFKLAREDAKREPANLKPADSLAAPDGASSSVPLITLELRVPAPGHGQLPALDQVHRIKQGDVVLLTVSTERAGMLMIHGLTEGMNVAPGNPARLVVVAKYSGRFAVHFHETDGSHAEIAAFEVYPP